MNTTRLHLCFLAALCGCQGSPRNAEDADDHCVPSPDGFVGLPLDATRYCTNTDHGVEILREGLFVCEPIVHPVEYGKPVSAFYKHSSEVESPPWFCVRRRADGRVFQFHSNQRVSIDPTIWTFCSPDEDGTRGWWDIPQPCFEATCVFLYADSTCAYQPTQEHFKCGEKDSKWDENCCRRTECSGDSPCEPGEECRETWNDLSFYCEATPGANGCICGQFLDYNRADQPVSGGTYCVPKDAH
jgi:hypothetical protein